MSETPLSYEQENMADLQRRLTETENALQSIIRKQIDAVIDPNAATTLLLLRAQESLRFSEGRYQGLFSPMAAIVFELDPDGTTRFVNDAILDVTGYSVEELEGKNWWNILCPDDQHTQVEELYRRFQSGDVTNYELIFTTKWGSHITLELYSANWKHEGSGEIARILGFCIDITEREHIEKDLQNYRTYLEQIITERAARLIESNNQLQQDIEERQALLASEQSAQDRAERVTQLQLKFLALISHELRTPLTSIKGFVTSLLAPDVVWEPEVQRQFMTIISEESDKLSNRITRMLDLSLLQSGMLRIQPVVLNLSDILDDTIGHLSTLAINHQLRITVAPDLPPIVADPQRLTEVLSNLVANAAKFAPERTCIAIKATRVQNMVQVDVNDEGPGIPCENRQLVFQAFRQLDRTLPQTLECAGFGLALCKGLIETHGGRIWVSEGSQTGTTISFTLPLAAQF
jgi:PAS domain S-box-containing protein